MTERKKPNEYLKVRIQTAQPTELLILLFDGAIRFATQAKRHIEERRLEDKNHLLLRTQDIVLELLQALDRSIGDDVYGRLVQLYRFCYERLLQANLKDDTRAADDAITILEHLRETWRLAIAKAREDRADATPPPRARHALSLEG